MLCSHSTRSHHQLTSAGYQNISQSYVEHSLSRLNSHGQSCFIKSYDSNPSRKFDLCLLLSSLHLPKRVRVWVEERVVKYHKCEYHLPNRPSFQFGTWQLYLGSFNHKDEMIRLKNFLIGFLTTLTVQTSQTKPSYLHGFKVLQRTDWIIFVLSKWI